LTRDVISTNSIVLYSDMSLVYVHCFLTQWYQRHKTDNILSLLPPTSPIITPAWMFPFRVWRHLWTSRVSL